MKNYLLYLSILFIFLITTSLLPFFILSQSPGGPSFEVYDSNCGEGINCTPYPAVWNVQINNRPDDNEIIITADVFDVSGVLSVIAIIEAPSGTEIEKHMRNVSGVYATQPIDIENYPSGLYKVHIQAIDILLNDSMGMNDDYRDMASFQIGSSEEIVELWADKTEVAWDNNSSPYRLWMWKSRAQFIILASELEAVGLNPGNTIKSFFIKASHKPTLDLLDFRIRIKSTTSTVSTSWEGGWISFFGPATVSKDDIVVGEWKEYSSEQEFVWDGNNIMVDISRHHPLGGWGSYSQSGGIYVKQNVGSYRMFAGNCDYCDLFDFSSGTGTESDESEYINYENLNFCPSLKIKYTSN